MAVSAWCRTHLVCVLIAGPVLAMVLVPGAVRAIGAGGVDGGRELLGRVTGWLLAVSGAVVVLLMIFSPVVAWTRGPWSPRWSPRSRWSR